MINIKHMEDYLTPPPLFERGAPMWNDPYVATQMLDYHLDNTHDIASRRLGTIDLSIKWLVNQLKLQAGMNLLDLGYGPGLYTKCFAKLGFKTTGIDYSFHSLDYAKKNDPDTTYICQNYVDLDLPDDSFDLVTLIYGDFCVLSNEERDELLSKLGRILTQGGYFVFDVTLPKFHQHLKNHNRWSIAPHGGFWKPTPYLLLEQGFAYPDDIFLHQYIIIQDDGTLSLYRNWYHDYYAETIAPILTAHGFHDVTLFADLLGTPYGQDSDWIGVLAKCSK